MQIKYFVEGLEVPEKPQNGEVYIEERWSNGRLAVEIKTTASTPEQRELSLIEAETTWRNEELDYVDSKSYGESFPYFAEVEAYKQLLRDYPSQQDFPNGERPERPVTPSGAAIIL